MGYEKQTTTCMYCSGTGDSGVKSPSYCCYCGGSGQVTESIYIPDPPSKGDTRIRLGASKDYLEKLAILIGMALWIYIAYIGIAKYNYKWYWSVGVGVLIGIASTKILSGPLRWLLKGTIKVVGAIIVIAVVVFIVWAIINK